MVGSLGWFWVRLSEAEVYEVIEAARRDGLIAPLGHDRRADGSEIKAEEWALTDEGRRLETVRTLNPRDLWLNLVGVGKQSGKIENGLKRGAAILAPLAPSIGVLLGVNEWTASAVGALILAFLVVSGLRGERAIGNAAEVWPRLQTCRPAVYRWMKLRGEQRTPPAAVLAIAGYALAVGVLLKLSGKWDFDPLLTGGAFLAVVGAVGLGSAKGWLERLRTYKSFTRERAHVYYIREHDPSNSCGLGHDCLAAIDDVPLCPVFGEVPVTRTPSDRARH